MLSETPLKRDGAADPPDVQKISERFCSAGADVTFQASDGILFKIYRKYLESHAGGFPPAEFHILDEIVPLTECSTTLELLFQFIHSESHPDLESIEFDALDALSEAVEKYQVYPAVNVCKVYMRQYLSIQFDRVMAYAFRHEYQDIIEAGAPLMVEAPLEDIISMVPPDLIIPWIRYHEAWTRICKSACSNTHYNYWTGKLGPNGDGMNTMLCPNCDSILDGIIHVTLNRLSEGVLALKNLNRTFDVGICCCIYSKTQLTFWRNRVEVQIGQIPGFITFI